MALYAGLPPDAALQQWFENRNAVAARYGVTPEQLQQGGFDTSAWAPADQMALSMSQLAQENPDAFRLLASGRDRVKQSGTDTRQVFNPQTGQWDTQDVKGWWSHPESWIQLGLGGAMGVAAPAAIASGSGSAAAGGAGAAGAVGGETAGAGLGAGAATAGTTAGVLPSTTIGAGYIPAVGGTGITGGVGGAATGGSILGKIASSPYLKNTSVVGQGISAASSAAGNTRRADTDTNVGAQSAFNSALLARAAAEEKQRNSALRDVYAAGYFRDQPRSPYNPAPVHGISQNYLQTLGGLEGQAMSRLAQPTQYGTNQMPELKPYNTAPGVGERIGNYAGPILSTIGAMYGQRPPVTTPPYVPYGRGY